MGIVKMDDVKQTKLDLELPDELGESNNYQYNKTREAKQEFITAMSTYLECKDYFEYKKSSLMVHTDWSKIFDHKPTVAEKEAWIIETMYKYRKQLTEKTIAKMDKEETYKIELIRQQG